MFFVLTNMQIFTSLDIDWYTVVVCINCDVYFSCLNSHSDSTHYPSDAMIHLEKINSNKVNSAISFLGELFLWKSSSNNSLIWCSSLAIKRFTNLFMCCRVWLPVALYFSKSEVGAVRQSTKKSPRGFLCQGLILHGISCFHGITASLQRACLKLIVEFQGIWCQITFFCLNTDRGESHVHINQTISTHCYDILVTNTVKTWAVQQTLRN